MQRKIHFILIGLLLAIASGFWIPNNAAYARVLMDNSNQPPSGREPPTHAQDFVPGEVLVKFRPQANNAQRQAILSADAVQSSIPIPQLGIHILTVSQNTMQSTLQALNNNPNVLFAEPNYIASATDTIPNDTLWGTQYNLTAIRAPQGWDLSTGDSGVVIAVIDSGVSLGHPDISGKLVAGYDFISNDTFADDDFGHGTHVAGIAAATTNNAEGIAGVSWGARIMPVKVLDSVGKGSYVNVALGIDWAVSHGADVICMSLGGANPSAVLETAVNNAIANNVIVVAASGNSNTTPIYYPSAYPDVIAVGATNSLNIRAGFSNYGPNLDLVAPGESIYSLGLGFGYVYRSGTSMATPHVAGLAAILLGIPGNTPAAVENQMESTALDLGSAGWDIYYGNGLIQMDSAIALARSITPTLTVTPTNTSTPTATATVTLTATSTPTGTPVPLIAASLPDTGFAPRDASSVLPVQPQEKAYATYSDLWMEIPSQGVKMAIVGVPRREGGWDVTWLGHNAGWLNGTSFPTWGGNSVLTGHVWDANNLPGPFYNLKELRYGEKVIIHAWGQSYTYEVQENALISPNQASKAMRHEKLAWITLLTCEGYNAEQQGYLFRRMVRAVLVSVKK